MTAKLSAIAVLLSGTAALAQQPAVSGEAAADAADIIVTADRFEASIQDVPISLTALAGETLERAGIRDTEGLANLTPGLLVQRSVVGKITIRGVGNENYTIAGDPGIAVHSDGIYVARASAGLFDLFDVERVEVLRGPQGTLYGRNATGGVINILPNRPTDRLEAMGAIEIGNYDAVRVEGMVNVPLGGGFTARVAGFGRWRDGFTTNIFPGADARGFGDLDSKDAWGVRGQLAFDNGGAFTARISVEHLDDNSNLPPYKYLNRPDALPDADFGGFGRRSLRTVNQGFEAAIPGSGRGVGSDEDFFLTRQTGVALHLGLDVGFGRITSLTGYRKTRFNWFNDGDGADVFYVNYIQQDANEQWSQEIQLASADGGRLDWFVGGYVFRETGSSFIALPFPFGFSLPFFIAIDGTAETTSFAGFGEARWRATDRLTLTAGLRYTSEKRATTYRYEINFGAPVVVNPDLEGSYNAFTPRFVVQYDLNEVVNLYASATRGFKSGGFNLLAIQPGFDPEFVWAYEGGVKVQTADRRLSGSANLVYYDYKDMQVGQIVNLQSVLTNAARSRIWGFEAEVTGQPMERLQLGGTLAWLDAKYKDFCTGDPTQPTAPVDPGCDPANPISLAGNTLPRAPEWTLTGFASLDFDLRDGHRLNWRGDVRYQSLVWFTQFNRPLISQPGYPTMNMALTWLPPSGRFELGLFVQNLFDEVYFTEVLESGAFNPQLVGQAYVAPPRTWGMRAAVRF